MSEDNENPFFGPSESTSEECLEDRTHGSKSEECLMDRKTLEKSLFGDDDSDWEPMEEGLFPLIFVWEIPTCMKSTNLLDMNIEFDLSHKKCSFQRFSENENTDEYIYE